MQSWQTDLLNLYLRTSVKPLLRRARSLKNARAVVRVVDQTLGRLSIPRHTRIESAQASSVNCRCDWIDPPLVGRDALLKIKLEGPSHLLVGFEMVDKAVPRGGYQVAIDGVTQGEVTTGMKSPTTGRFVGLAYVPASHAKLGSTIDILIRDQPKRAVVVKRPFYVAAYRR